MPVKTDTPDKPAEAQKKVPPSPDVLFATLVTSMQKYIPNVNVDVLNKAYKYAADKHGAQQRHSGELYITHPLEVANILTELRLDQSSIVAAILHDVVEDTSTTIEDVKNEFGAAVADLVDGLTKISKINFSSKHERLAENFRKMIVAMARDLRVILIKLGDRLHNMRTITCLPPEKARRIAQETMDIYAPLANRLGVYGIKSELEDLCLRQLKHDIYQTIRSKVAAKKAERQAFIEEVKTILETELKKYGFKNVSIQGRPKHFFSIYKKMVERQLEFEDVHDLFAFRILVDSIKDCYEALGVVHAMWKPMPGRFKDYIAMPKANMYQSLHTTAIRPNGEPAEIQIRTHEMNAVCEFGVAAHWQYKERKPGSEGSKDDLQKFSWLRQIVQWQSELKDPNEFMEALKVDLFDEEIFVFTPKGDVISLPRNSTALDFAFGVHTGIGLSTTGAKVNGRIAPLKKPLKSGDIVEILTSPQQRPNKDWLNFVVTTKARSKIRASLRSEERTASRQVGEEILAKELSERHLDYDKLRKAGDLEKLHKHGKESNFDDLLIGIGYGKVNVADLVDRAFPESKAKISLIDAKPQIQTRGSIPTSQGTGGHTGILVSGLENVLVSFAKCCSPLPGEDVVGFVTRGRGVTVHRSSCSRAIDIDPHRQIHVSWANTEVKGSHAIYLRITTRDKPGVLAEVSSAIAACGANIQKAEVRINADLVGILDFELGVNNLTQLENVVHKLESIPAVISVERRGQPTARSKPKSKRPVKRRNTRSK